MHYYPTILPTLQLPSKVSSNKKRKLTMPNATSPQRSYLVTILPNSKNLLQKSLAESIKKEKKKKRWTSPAGAGFCVTYPSHFQQSFDDIHLHLSGGQPFWCNTEDTHCFVLKTVKSSLDLYAKAFYSLNCVTETAPKEVLQLNLTST